jgi:ferredoxin
LCDEVFELNEEGKSVVKAGADLEKNAECIKQAIESCPVQAIEE